jgi:hypothetical protein
MEIIGKLRIGTAVLDIIVERRPSVVTLRIGDEDSRWRAERVIGKSAGADLWRHVKAAAHRAVADYLELGTRPSFEKAATAVYVEVGALGIVRAELGDDDSTDATARLMTKVARRLARLEHEVLDGNGQRITVTIPE